MKKNAVLVASILFVAAGCAHQSGSNRAASDSRMDTTVESSGTRYNTENVMRNPDGSPQSPASTASQYDPGTYSDRINSSDPIRAHGVEPYSSAQGSAGGTVSGSASSSSSLNIDGTARGDTSSTRDDFGQGGSSANWKSDKANGSVRGSANWNASDDLLQDGTSRHNLNTDASVGGAASSEVGQGSSASSGSGNHGDIRSSHGDLNSSPKLEENISGEFTLPESSRETGIQNSGRLDEPAKPQVGVTGNEPEPHFSNNPAHGVGSPRTGEVGNGSSINSPDRLDHQPLGHDLEDSTDQLQPE